MKKDIIDRGFIIPKFEWNDIFSPVLIERKSIYDFLVKTVIRMYGKDIRKEKIMDFGCGQAPYYCLFRAKNYIGVDVKQSGHDNAEKHADVYYNDTVPFSDETFRYVIATQCLEHIADIDEILKEISRVMCKGGKLIITVPMLWIDHEMPYDYYRFTEQGIRYKLEKNGFRIIYIRKLNGADDAAAQLKMLLIDRNNKNVIYKKMCIAYENIKYIYRYKKKIKQDNSVSTCIGIIVEKKESLINAMDKSGASV